MYIMPFVFSCQSY